MLRSTCLIFYTLSLYTVTYSQETTLKTDTLRQIIEEGWIENMSSQVAIGVSLDNSEETFEVKNPTNKYVIKPNAPTHLKFKFSHKFISFGFGFAPDFIPYNGDNELKGKTKSSRLGMDLTFKHWVLGFSYSKVKGYYLENTADFKPLLENDPYIQFPDLHYNGIALNFGYSNNSKFSLKSIVSQTQRQLKSAGSFLPVLNARYYIIDDKSLATSTQKSNNIEVSIGPGYAYTLVVKEKFYVSLGLMTSIGYLNTELTTRFPTQNIITNQDNLIVRWDGKIGIGHNGNRFYSGVYATYSGTEYEQEGTNAINAETRIFYHLFLGIRIAPPGFVNRQMAIMEEKMSKYYKM